MFFQPSKDRTILKIIATPIGNLKEVNDRAMQALQYATCLLCEDTRVSKKLLTNLQIEWKDKKFISFQKFNENDRVDLAINEIKTHPTVLITDAGYPCISDPGHGLVKKCYENNIAVEVINGPSAIMHALVVSGLNTNNFFFNGFLPASATQRKTKLQQLKPLFQQFPIVFFESVHRINQSLQDIDQIFNHPFFVVARELTKINETIYRGYYQEIKNEIIAKGEFVIVVQNDCIPAANIQMEQIVDLILEEQKKNPQEKLKVICKQIATKFNQNASLVYNAVIKQKKLD